MCVFWCVADAVGTMGGFAARSGWRADGGGRAGGATTVVGPRVANAMMALGVRYAGGREAGLPMKSIGRVVLTDGAGGSNGAFAT